MAATLSGGNNSTRLFLINNHSKLSLRGLNLAHGHEAGQHFGDGSSFGGAIFVSHAGALILDSVSITASWAFRGGAIYAIGSSVLASDSTLSSNSANWSRLGLLLPRVRRGVRRAAGRRTSQLRRVPVAASLPERRAVQNSALSVAQRGCFVNLCGAFLEWNFGGAFWRGFLLVGLLVGLFGVCG